jgi:AcrR family transcriptional regulator
MTTVIPRQDTSRNQELVLKAAQRLLAESPTNLSMRKLAEEANISPATIYRYYGTIDGVVESFRQAVISSVVAKSEACTDSGIQLLKSVCLFWVDLVIKDGKAMSHSRSRTGYMQRLRAQTPDILMQEAAMSRPLAEACRELKITVPGEEALFLWNQIFDPRDVLDLMDSLKLGRVELRDRLLHALLGSLKGWATGKEPL